MAQAEFRGDLHFDFFGILDEDRAAGMGLIAMATHGRTGLQRLLLGSVASSVLRRGGLPLLLVRPLAKTSRPQAAAARDLP